MFSVLPLVFAVVTDSVGSVSLITVAAASPNNGKPPPGVAVASVTRVVWANAVVGTNTSAASTPTAIVINAIGASSPGLIIKRILWTN
jgi:hypothetical protein